MDTAAVVEVAVAMVGGLVMAAASRGAVKRVGTVAWQEGMAAQEEGQLAGALLVVLAALMGGRSG